MEQQMQTPHKKRVKPAPERLAFGLDEAAVSIGVSTSLLRLEANRGRLKTYKIGKRILISAESFKAYLAEREGSGNQGDGTA
jgi:excisionase family DNA binding protein